MIWRRTPRGFRSEDPARFSVMRIAPADRVTGWHLYDYRELGYAARFAHCKDAKAEAERKEKK